MLFNPQEHDVHKMAQTLSTFFESKTGALIDADKALNQSNKQRLETIANSLKDEKDRLNSDLEHLQLQCEQEQQDWSPALRPREDFFLSPEMDSDSKNRLCDEVEALDARYSAGILKLIKEEMSEITPVS